MKKKTSSFWKQTAYFLIDHHRGILLSTVLISFIMLFGLLRARIVTDMRDFYSQDNKELSHQIESQFDEGLYAEIIFESKEIESLLSVRLMQKQWHVLQKIKENFKVRTHSLVEGVNHILKKQKGKTLDEVDSYNEIAHVILNATSDKERWDLAKVTWNLVSNRQFIKNYRHLKQDKSKDLKLFHFIPPNVKAMKAYIQLDSSYSKVQHKQIFNQIRLFTEKFQTEDFRIYHLGAGLVELDIESHAQMNTKWMGLILFLINAMLLWWLYRKPREVVLTLVILAISCLWSFGLASWLGFRFSFLHLIAIPILLGTGMDDNIMFVRSLRLFLKNHQKKESLSLALEQSGNAIFLTTFTTFIAFLSGALVSSSEAIRSFFALVALSMIMVLILTLILQISMRQFFSESDNLTEYPPSAFGKTLENLFFWHYRHRKTIFPVLMILFLISVFLSRNLEATADVGQFLRRSMPTYQSDQIQDFYFGTNIFGYIYFTGDVASIPLLRKIKNLQREMAHLPYIEMIFERAFTDSVLDLIEKKNILLSPRVDAQKLFEKIYTDSSISNMMLNESYADYSKHFLHKGPKGFDALLLRFSIAARNSKQFDEFHSKLEKLITDQHFERIPNIKLHIGGGSLANYRESSAYFDKLVTAFLYSLMINFLVLLIFWRDFKLAIYALIPLLFSLSLSLGLMALLNFKLNVLNICIGSIVVGLGIDYPIHMIEDYRKDILITDTLKSMGIFIFIASLTTIVGFGITSIFAMPIAESFGFLTAFAILVVSLTSLLWLPLGLQKTPEKHRH